MYPGLRLMTQFHSHRRVAVAQRLHCEQALATALPGTFLAERRFSQPQRVWDTSILSVTQDYGSVCGGAGALGAGSVSQ